MTEYREWCHSRHHLSTPQSPGSWTQELQPCGMSRGTCGCSGWGMWQETATEEKLRTQGPWRTQLCNENFCQCQNTHDLCECGDVTSIAQLYSTLTMPGSPHLGWIPSLWRTKASLLCMSMSESRWIPPKPRVATLALFQIPAEKVFINQVLQLIFWYFKVGLDWICLSKAACWII